MPVYAATFDSLAKICEQVRQASINAGFASKDVYQIELAVDEACANIIEHSYGGEGRGEIECLCEQLENGLKITITDFGCCFDPADIPEPDLASPVEERCEGGLGLYFMRHAMDQVIFEPYQGNGTRLIMVKYKQQGG